MDDSLILMLMDDHDDPIQTFSSESLLHHRNFAQEHPESTMFQSTNQRLDIQILP